MVINLAGIQSLDIPPSLFDDFFNRENFAVAKYPECPDVKVQITHERDNKYQDKERALVVTLQNAVIGYIPTTGTIDKYIKSAEIRGRKARAANDLATYEKCVSEYKKHSARKDIVDIMRGQIETDLFINKDPYVEGTICRVQRDEDTGEILSISVGIVDN